MPTITINEKDLTSAGLSQATSNAVFIPGYANIGPVNTPILCETETDFKTTFGSDPYVFRESYTLTETADTDGATAGSLGEIKFNSNSYEQSYIYALEILRGGMPVVYSRVFNDDNKTTWTPAATISVGETEAGTSENLVTLTSKYPGAYYKNIRYELTGATDSTPFKLVLELGDSSSEYYIKELFYIAFSDEEKSKYPDYNVYSYGNLSSELVNFEWGEDPTSSLGTNENNIEGYLTLGSEATGDEFDPTTDVYENLSDQLEIVEDKNEYFVKFITSGAYPTFGKGYSQNLINSAYTRGDCVALVDAFPNTTQTATKLHERVVNKSFSNGEYGSMFTPWGYYTCTSVDSTLMMPASFGYLTAYATSIQNNPGWLAVAGATRGVASNLVNNIGPRITNAMVDIIEGRATTSINPITQVKPYGNLIWGNRTLKNNAIKGNLTAQSFLNIRCLLSELKQVVYSTAKGLTFEQNSDILWINFKAGIVPTLDQMTTGNGLSGYEIKRASTTKRATLKALIRLYAIEAVEDFEVDIELSDSEVTTVE